jgi:hypothetical protein
VRLLVLGWGRDTCAGEFSSIVCSLLEEKGCGVSKQIVGGAEINRKWGMKRNR